MKLQKKLEYIYDKAMIVKSGIDFVVKSVVYILSGFGLIIIALATKSERMDIIDILKKSYFGISAIMILLYLVLLIFLILIFSSKIITTKSGKVITFSVILIFTIGILIWSFYQVL